MGRFAALRSLLLAAVLAACGGDASEAAAGSEISAEETRRFADVDGEEIEVPSDPQRIVAIHDSNGGEQVMSLGVEVVWRQLAAVRAGQVYEWDSSWFGTTFHRYDLVLDAFGPELVAADRSVVT